MIKNKKADASILLLVLLVLILVGASLLIFITRENVAMDTVKPIEVMSYCYAKQEALVFFLKSLAENTQTSGMNEEQFLTEFKKNYLQLAEQENTFISRSNILEPAYLYLLKDEIAGADNSKYEISIQGNLLKFKLRDFSLRESEVKGVAIDTGAVVECAKDIEFEISF